METSVIASLREALALASDSRSKEKVLCLLRSVVTQLENAVETEFPTTATHKPVQQPLNLTPKKSCSSNATADVPFPAPRNRPSPSQAIAHLEMKAKDIQDFLEVGLATIQSDNFTLSHRYTSQPAGRRVARDLAYCLMASNTARLYKVRSSPSNAPKRYGILFGERLNRMEKRLAGSHIIVGAFMRRFLTRLNRKDENAFMKLLAKSQPLLPLMNIAAGAFASRRGPNSANTSHQNSLTAYEVWPAKEDLADSVPTLITRYIETDRRPDITGWRNTSTQSEGRVLLNHAAFNETQTTIPETLNTIQKWGDHVATQSQVPTMDEFNTNNLSSATYDNMEMLSGKQNPTWLGLGPLHPSQDLIMGEFDTNNLINATLIETETMTHNPSSENTLTNMTLWTAETTPRGFASAFGNPVGSFQEF